MIKKTKHPTNKLERRVIAKKKIHSNASPVYLLLKEKEEQDASASKHRVLSVGREPT
jgi:hypothetical protein